MDDLKSAKDVMVEHKLLGQDASENQRNTIFVALLLKLDKLIDVIYKKVT